MELSRRNFFGGALALTAVTIIPMADAVAAPMIYGDGIHDDAPGLQALIDGRSFRVKGAAERCAYRAGDGSFHINGGRFRLGHGLRFGPTSSGSITNCTFDTRGSAEGIMFAKSA